MNIKHWLTLLTISLSFSFFSLTPMDRQRDIQDELTQQATQLLLDTLQGENDRQRKLTHIVGVLKRYIAGDYSEVPLHRNRIDGILAVLNCADMRQEASMLLMHHNLSPRKNKASLLNRDRAMTNCYEIYLECRHKPHNTTLKQHNEMLELMPARARAEEVRARAGQNQPAPGRSPGSC